MPDERNPDTATAVLPAIQWDATTTAGTASDLLTDHDADVPWRVRSALLEVSAQSIFGPCSRVRFPISGGRLHLAGPAVTGFELHSPGPERISAGSYRALLGRRTHSSERPAGLELHCSAAPVRRKRASRRMGGEVVVNGLPRTLSLRIKLIDVGEQRVLLWLTGPLRLPATDRRVGKSFPHVQIAAEFTR
ncbi:MAG: hypothetical protein ACRDSP_15085 [Pseudonocardiaceae bacterium]